MKNRLFFLMLGLIFSANLSSQITQNVRGTVVDLESQFPLIGVNVVIPLEGGEILGTTTDVDGEFIIAGSANFNERSFNEFSELNVLITGDTASAQVIRESYVRRRAASRKVSDSGELAYRKAKQWCEYIFG